MIASQVLMIRPIRFGYNAETAVNNAFQHAGGDHAQVAALKEFDAFVALLRAQDIAVTVFDDTPAPHTPDSIFPNNWISFHPGGLACLYPMFAENRRQERKAIDIIKNAFPIRQFLDFTHYETRGLFLEGTGSMVFDRRRQIAYACLSPRTNEEVLHDFCRQMHFSPALFHATDANGQAVYHTNVMLCVADRFAVVCLESITDKQEQTLLADTLKKTGKEIIPITMAQMACFAGNMLQLQNRAGKRFLILSHTARRALESAQVSMLEKYNELISPSVPTIERNGGGSVRCMLAEVF
ncbi:MAG: amidinotransferase [Prevotellaceae bacterium]|jgi:hypothetical protein|nr:amidinotransferase [Prevotellaceae bacterium]